MKQNEKERKVANYTSVVFFNDLISLIVFAIIVIALYKEKFSHINPDIKVITLSDFLIVIFLPRMGKGKLPERECGSIL